MNRKQLITLLVFGAVIAAAWMWVNRGQKAADQQSTAKMGEKLVPNFPVNDVAQLTIKQRGAELNLAKKDELWVVKERGEYPANFSNLRDLLIKVSDLKITKPVNVGTSRLPQLELLPPDKAPSTLVEFKDAKGGSIKSLLLGAKHMREGQGDPQMGGGAWPDGRYVMVNSDIKSAALIADPLATAEAKPEDWLNKDWFKVEKLRSISVTTTNATNNWKLSRDSETNEWKLAEIKPGEQPDSGKISGVTSALSNPSFNDVSTNTAPDKTGLGKPLFARLETTDGFSYDVKVGNKMGEEAYYFQMSVNANIQKERTPGKDEKPEDKLKLDKEFNDHKTKLEEKLKAEKAYEKWTYVVSKWSIEPLLKDRKDLLVEKKEEPKPADKAEAKPAPEAK